MSVHKSREQFRTLVAAETTRMRSESTFLMVFAIPAAIMGFIFLNVLISKM